jgi:RecB family exonuclease
VLCLAPGHPEAPAFAYARGFWRRHLGVEPATIRTASATPPRLAGDRLLLLYDEEARPAPLPGACDLAHAQGPAAEIGEAVRILLRDWRAGADGPGRRPDGVALIGRTLAPYALHLTPVLGAHGLPCDSSATLPAARQPVVQAAVWLLRCLTADFPAATLCDLLRTGFVRAPGAAGRNAEEPPRADAAERLLRDWQLSGGRLLITEHLPGWVEAERPVFSDNAGAAERDNAVRIAAGRRQEARRLARLVRRLAQAGQPLLAARTWTAWAMAFGDLLRRHVRGYAAEDAPTPGVDCVLGALRDLGALDAAGVPLVPGAAAAVFEGAVEAAALPIGSVAADGSPVEGDGGGVRVLDAMQARGLAFDTVVLIGMNADLFPRRPREDPFLPDGDRRLLREAQARPLPLASEARDEEHLLLALLAGAARRRLVVLWQHADDDGRARTPSLALREVARALLGTSELAAIDAAAVRVSADPAERLRVAVDVDGMIAPEEAGLAAGFASRSPGALRAALGAAGGAMPPGLLAAGDAVPAGLALLESIEGTAPTPFDALVGPPGDAPAVWSPSRLETLGGCPQRFFFRHVLRVAEWEAPLQDHEIDARDLGALAHGVLRDLYEALAPAAGGAGGDPARRAGAGAPDAGRIRVLLEAAWHARSAAVAARMRLRYPGLWDLLEAKWLRAIEEFALADTAGLAEALEPPRLEHAVEATIALGPDGGELRLRGRLDRLLRHADGLVVADYKTGGRPARFIEPAAILKGERLQLPLYVLLAERAAGGDPPPRVRAEVLGVGPAFARLEPDERAAALDPDRFAQLRGGFLETLAVLVDLVRVGLYPLDPERDRCARCPYVRACRRTHGPTLDRLAAHPALSRFHAIRAKSTRAQTLADVARRSAGGAG